MALTARDASVGRSAGEARGWSLSIAELVASGSGWRTGGFRLDATVTRSDDGLEAQGTLALAGRRLADFALVLDDTGTFARLDVPPTRIGPGGIAADALITPVPDVVADPSGVVEAAAVLAYGDTREERAWLSLTEGALELAGIRLSGIRSELAFEALLPPVTLPGQKLSVARIEAGLSLGPAEVLFELGEGPRLAVRRASLAVAGGRMVARPFALDLRQPEAVVEAEISGVDLAQLVAELALEGLEATGRLEGDARLRIAPDFELYAAPVLLRARDGGIVRRHGAPGTAPADPRMALLYEVLEDFHYTRLEGELEGPLSGELRLRLSLEGANPAVYGGYPVALDLRFEGPLGRILRQGIRGYRLPESLGRQLRERLR